MDYVDDRFNLDLMLVPGRGHTWKKILQMEKTRENVRISHRLRCLTSSRSPIITILVCFSSLQPILISNIHFQINLFEFIQARLGVAIGPSIEMRKIVEKIGAELVSPRLFLLVSMALELNKIDKSQVTMFKSNSDAAAKILNADENGKKVLAMVNELLENEVPQHTLLSPICKNRPSRREDLGGTG